MLWILLSILSALSASIKNAISKASVKNLDEYLISLSLFLFAIPFLILFIDFQSIPFESLKYWMLLVLAIFFDIPAFIFMLKSFKKSDLSLILPLVVFIPVFIILIEFFVFRVTPSIQGILGILVIVFGTYILVFNWKKKGLFTPIKNIFSDAGARYILISILLWSVAANIHKMGVQLTSPLNWTFSALSASAIVLLVIVLLRKPKLNMKSTSIFVFLILIGFLHALENLAQNFALKETFASFVIAIKQSHILFGVLLGYLFFKEKNIRKRFLGAVIMIIGVLLIIFS